ncbi:hypothetical protein N9B82_06410 [Saprospiraceae bacterium]|nr:hypothetical protein [Saprospiraceae bacterium]
MKNLKTILDIIKKSSPILYWNAIIISLFIGFSFIGLFVDDRTLLGINVWIKPLKFSISTCIYILTVGYLLPLYPYSKKKKKTIAGIVSWSLLIEMLIILFQAFRGIQSHFNQTSLANGILFGLMGLLIAVNVIIMVLFLFDTVRLKLKAKKSVQLAILLGWVIVIIGSWVGGQMISQMSHNVGVVDGGAGIPILNWSTKAGDLRIAHFFGLHGIQIIPLFAVWISNILKKSTAKQVIAVTTFSLVYAGWIAFTFYQAKQGMPLIAIN